MRHYTSRAGDPHRHLHLQINARVFAAGKWRGLDTVGVRDSIDRDQRHRARRRGVRPGVPRRARRARLHPHRTGEIAQLAPFIGAFSKRAAQIGAQHRPLRGRVARAHPGEEPGPGVAAGVGCAGVGRRPAGQGHARSRVRSCRPVAERAGRARLPRPRQADPARPRRWPARWTATPPSTEVFAGLGAAVRRGTPPTCAARSSSCSPANGIVADVAVRGELAEDLTARALGSVRAAARAGGVPEHIRALTSRHVLDVEADLVARLAARGAEPARDAGRPVALVDDDALDAGQRGRRRRIGRRQRH